MRKPGRCHSLRRRAGLSIVEALISLSISAMLLTAVAAAFSASSQVIEANDQFFRASQAARISMNQLLTQIRRCSAIDVSADGKTISLITDDGRDLSYVHDGTDPDISRRVLKLITNTDGAAYTLATHVHAMAFSGDSVQDEGGIRHTVRVSVTLTTAVGNNRIQLSGSASPRRAQKYVN
jgi:type II secretory pathway pseudopilin PulG